MLMLRLSVALASILIATTCYGASPAPASPIAAKVLVLGHRGASALRPEHTLASYGQAIEDGADFVEPDLVMTKDGIPVARHENEISGTTDVAKHPEFAARKTTKTIDGQPVTGWFTEDFTLAEFKTLRARERLPELRANNAKFDGQFSVPTFDEIIDFVAAESKKRGRAIGIYPEIKHSTYFKGLGLPMEDVVLGVIRKHAYTAKTAPLFIQSFEVDNLKYLRGKLGKDLPNVKLIQLLGEDKEQPYDAVAAKRSLNFGQMMQPQGLAEIAKYADAIGPNKLSVIPRSADGKLAAPTALVKDAHAVKLLVHPWTFRPENYFLPSDLRAAGTPATRNDTGAVTEIRAYLDAGIDGFFTDDPALGRKAVDR